MLQSLSYREVLVLSSLLLLLLFVNNPKLPSQLSDIGNTHTHSHTPHTHTHTHTHTTSQFSCLSMSASSASLACFPSPILPTQTSRETSRPALLQSLCRTQSILNQAMATSQKPEVPRPHRRMRRQLLDLQRGKLVVRTRHDASVNKTKDAYTSYNIALLFPSSSSFLK